MSLVKQIAILAVIVLVGAALWYSGFLSPLIETDGEAQADGGRRDRDRMVPVLTQPVRMISESTVVQSPGTGVAIKSVTLFPEAEGRVTEILFSAGQTVKKGAPLLRLDDRAERLALELARVHLKEARRQLERKQKLVPRGAVARSELELAQTAVDAARVTAEQRAHSLGKRTLLAPFAGVIGIPQIDPGERVSETTPIATLDDRSTLLVDFEVPEAHAGRVAIGAGLDITAWAMGDRRFKGKVHSISSQIDPTTRTLRVRATIPNEHDLLRPGMSFVVRLPLAGKRYPSVPSVAVQWDREGAFVWRIVESAAERVAVRILKRTDKAVLVDAPLAAGDAVVVEGVQHMRPGVPVRKPKGGGSLQVERRG